MVTPQRWLLLALTLCASLGQAAEILWLDGRRETVARVVVREDRVLIPFEKGMRSVSKRSVVRAIGDDGEEIALDRRLGDAPLDGEAKAALTTLLDSPPERAHEVQIRLADTMSRAAFEWLVEQTKAKSPESRARAATTLLLMGVEESVLAGVAVALSDKDPGVRLRVASTLLEVCGALKPDAVAPGLADSNVPARLTFALVAAKLGDDRAIPVLKAAGLKNHDHHMRESAAEALADLGDPAGVSVLIGMLKRTRHPAGRDLPEAVFIAEKVRVCGQLGRLRAPEAQPALQQAARSKNEDLAAAAKRALELLREQKPAR